MKFYSDKIIIFFIICLPVSIIIGPLFSDLSISIISLLFLLFLNKKEYKFFFFNKFSLFFFIWLFYLVLSSILSNNVFLSFESTLFYFRFWIFSLCFCYILINHIKTLNYFLISVCLSFSILIIDSYFQLIFGYNFLGYEYNYQLNQSRLSGLFGDEKVLGSYLARLSPLLLISLVIFKDKIPFDIYFFIILLFLIFVLILFSGERTSIILYCIFLLFFIFDLNLLTKKTRYIWYLIFPLILFFVILINSSQNIQNRIFNYTFQQLYQGDNFNIFSIQHQVVYNTSIKIFLDNKFFGIGPKLFREECKNYYTFSDLDNSINGCQTHPHNTYVQMLVETGLIGSFFVICIFLYICIELFKLIKNSKFLKISHSSDKIIYKYSLLMIFVSLFPLVPTGNFFNNWINSIYYLPVGYVLYYQLYISKKII